MATDPIKIQNYEGVIHNSREKLMEEQGNMNNKKKFIFSTYMTQKERLVNKIII